MSGQTKVVSKPKGPREKHYTWTGGSFPKPDTSAIEFYNGVETEYVGGNTLIVRVNDVALWPRVHERAAYAVARAAGGTDIQK